MNLSLLNSVRLNNKKLIENFTNDYINYISKDIFKAISFFEKNNMHCELNKLHCLIKDVFNNVIKNLSEVLAEYNPDKITRLGDMHGYNKCTLLMESGNNKFIFKPIQCHFLTLINELLLLFNHSEAFDFYILKIISSHNFGTVIEFIENEKIYDLNRFSFHYGAIVFLFTLLRGTDFHFDNIFVISSTPVAIDFETLFYPNILEFKSFDATATSLIKTKMNSHTIMTHYNLNKEMMIKGIHSAYELVKNNRKTVYYLINYYHSKLARVILKPTSYYYDLLRKSSHPALLVCSETRMKFLEKCLACKKKLSFKIMKYEIEDLMNFNIPYFYFKNGELYSSKNVLIKQNMIFSSRDLILTELKRLKYFKSKLIEVVLSSA